MEFMFNSRFVSTDVQEQTAIMKYSKKETEMQNRFDFGSFEYVYSNKKNLLCYLEESL